MENQLPNTNTGTAQEATNTGTTSSGTVVANNATTQTQPTITNIPSNQTQSQSSEQTQIPPELQGYVNKLVQSAGDTVRTQYSNDLKQLQAKYSEALAAQRSTMTEAEKAKFDLERERGELEAAKKQFSIQQNQNYAISKLVTAGYIDADENGNLLLVDLVTQETADTATIDKRVSNLKSVIDRIVKSQVDERFKSAGRDVNNGVVSGGSTNLSEGSRLAARKNEQMKQRSTLNPWNK